MRAVAFSVWIFLNLAFLGMGGYIYLILSTYWCRQIRQVPVQRVAHKKVKFDRENHVIFYEPKEAISEERFSSKVVSIENENELLHNKIIFKKLNRSRRRSSIKPDCKNQNSNLNNYNLNCTNLNQLNENKIEKFKNKLFIQMRRVMHEESNVFKTDNPYFVNYNGPRKRYQGLSSNEIKCRLKRAGLRLLEKNDPPFNNLRFGPLLGEEPFLDDKRFKTCAIVSSAGSLLHSNLGKLIDSHEIVVRFNHAPTENYENDVGKKTTIRLVNSQVVSKKEFMFTTSPLYKNVTLVVWDPSNYSTTLQQWYEKPDFNFFELWAKQKIINSKKDSYILDPRSVWRVWDFIQSLTALRIRRNPPSSGFLGLVLLMPYCDYIDFFEFVPSLRLTKKCHYFDNIEDDSCTFGVWHPLSAEKMLSLAMNEANDTTIFETGFIRIKGYKNLQC